MGEFATKEHAGDLMEFDFFGAGIATAVAKAIEKAGSPYRERFIVPEQCGDIKASSGEFSKAVASLVDMLKSSSDSAGILLLKEFRILQLKLELFSTEEFFQTDNAKTDNTEVCLEYIEGLVFQLSATLDGKIEEVDFPTREIFLDKTRSDSGVYVTDDDPLRPYLPNLIQEHKKYLEYLEAKVKDLISSHEKKQTRKEMGKLISFPTSQAEPAASSRPHPSHSEWSSR